LESHRIQERTRQTKGTFSVQYLARDVKSQVQKTGHNALNARDSGMNSVLHLKVLSPLCVTFSKHIGNALHTLRSKGTQECAFATVLFFVICQEKHISV